MGTLAKYHPDYAGSTLCARAHVHQCRSLFQHTADEKNETCMHARLERLEQRMPERASSDSMAVQAPADTDAEMRDPASRMSKETHDNLFSEAGKRLHAMEPARLDAFTRYAAENATRTRAVRQRAKK